MIKICEKIFFVIFIFVFLNFLGGKVFDKAFESKVLPESIRVEIDGTLCSFCVDGLERSFAKQESVRTALVVPSNKGIDIYLNKDMSIEDEKIKSIVKKAGYNVKEIKRNEKSFK